MQRDGDGNRQREGGGEESKTAVIERRDTSREPADNKRRQCRQTEMNKAKCTDEVNEVISRIEK